MLLNNHFSYAENDVPVIFIPGLFGSMSNEIIPGTGDWGFGMAKLVYDPFIEILLKIGYKLNKDLFISFYDWRKSCQHSARKYLSETIEHVKEITGSDMVNLICHSMGSLVARAYIQSDFYEYDVDKMIIIATPNVGSPPSYSPCESGELPNSQNLGLNFIKLHIHESMLGLGDIYKNDKIEDIHTNFEALYDLLPSSQYHNYLFYKEFDGAMALESYSKMKCKNIFLDELNENINTIEKRGIDVTIIAEIGEKTMNFLHVVPSESEDTWADGRVVGFTQATDGDGNTVLNSAFSLEGEKYILKGSHIDILYKCEGILKKVLLK
ncbi:esterase/lipase family protein [Wukongibacter sp. M2B1]|uniref:esterase/lipase family protein n=1 Tax=Wukongibacter sp. M2B1 TaxID=3088895 RepID=UPI003D79A4BF